MDHGTTEYAIEPIGWKVLLGGSFTSFTAWISAIDWVALIGVTIMVCGFALQLAGWVRSREDHKMAKEADKRAREKHEAEMAVLMKKLQSDGDNS